MWWNYDFFSTSHFISCCFWIYVNWNKDWKVYPAMWYNLIKLKEILVWRGTAVYPSRLWASFWNRITFWSQLEPKSELPCIPRQLVPPSPNIGEDNILQIHGYTSWIYLVCLHCQHFVIVTSEPVDHLPSGFRIFPFYKSISKGHHKTKKKTTSQKKSTSTHFAGQASG